MRLVTRSDFDGLVSGALLKELGVIDEMFLTHPKDLEDGKVVITENDVLVSVPYVKGCGLWFDHHSDENECLNLDGEYKGCSKLASSTARVVYDYYGGEEKLGKFKELMDAADKADSAQFSKDDILNPRGWELLSFICDPHTGLGSHLSYRTSDKQLMEQLLDHLRTKSLDEIMAEPDVKERVDRYNEQNEPHKKMLEEHSRVDGPIVITDLRGVSEIPPGNRHRIYTLYPDANISIRLTDDSKKQFVAISVGYSVLNRTATIDVGSLMLMYGGGGHKHVGACQVSCDDADKVVDDIVEMIKTQS